MNSIIFLEKGYEFSAKQRLLNVSKQESNYEIYGSAIYKLVNIEKVERF